MEWNSDVWDSCVVVHGESLTFTGMGFLSIGSLCSQRMEIDFQVMDSKRQVCPTLGTTAGDRTSSSSSLAASATALARGLRLAAVGAAALSAGPAALLAAGFLAAGALREERLHSGLHRL